MHAIKRWMIVYVCVLVAWSGYAYAALDQSLYRISTAAGAALGDVVGQTESMAVRVGSRAALLDDVIAATEGAGAWASTRIGIGTVLGWVGVAFTAYQLYNWAEPRVAQWLADNGYTLGASGWTKPGGYVTVAGAPGVGVFSSSSSGNLCTATVYPGANEALAACQAMCTPEGRMSYCAVQIRMDAATGSADGWNTGMWQGYVCYKWNYPTDSSHYTSTNFIWPTTCVVNGGSCVVGGTSPVTPSEIAGKLSTDAQAGNQHAYDATTALLDQAKQAFGDGLAKGESSKGIEAAQWPSIERELLAGISPTDQDTTANKLSPDGMAAQKNAQQPIDWGSFSGPPSTPEPDPAAPEKKSLTTVLQWFMDQVTNLPVISSLQGNGFELQGEVSYIDFGTENPIPGGEPWSRRVDFAEWQAVFQGMGVVMLSCTTIFCIVRLFRGGQ